MLVAICLRILFLDIGLIARKNQPTYAEAQMCHEQKKWLRFDATRSLAWDSWLYKLLLTRWFTLK